MNYSSLSDLISMIEFGTNLHISIVFLSDFGNEKTVLPFESTFHCAHVCDHFKKSAKGLKKCFRCRNIALNKARTLKKSFGGVCINGVFEYLRPIIFENEVIAVIFIGNIYRENEKIMKLDSNLILSLEKDYNDEKCIKTADLIESYILFLAKEYPKSANTSFNPLIQNIKNFIEENLNLDIPVSQLAQMFGYNEKYLGRLFKAKTGVSITEYINQRRTQKIIPLIKNTDIPITEISLRAGFNNVTYFNKVFKRQTGITPTEIRKK